MGDRIIDDAVLEDMASDAFEVLNWARRIGLKRTGQEEQVVLAFRKTLSMADVAVAPARQKEEK